MRIADECPNYIPVLAAAAAVARETETQGGRFAGRWVLQEVERTLGRPWWVPGLNLLLRYGLLEKAGDSSRGKHRAYYRMRDRTGVEAAIRRIEEGVRVGQALP